MCRPPSTATCPSAPHPHDSVPNRMALRTRTPFVFRHSLKFTACTQLLGPLRTGTRTFLRSRKPKPNAHPVDVRIERILARVFVIISFCWWILAHATAVPRLLGSFPALARRSSRRSEGHPAVHLDTFSFQHALYEVLLSPGATLKSAVRHAVCRR
ncbi:hypothetical protein C8R45DRAFT_597834 [Mycena sanguinolenta]|nr:hypothetical protein C8R45DRAFT_597834 [Mycena sanguinolenta]